MTLRLFLVVLVSLLTVSTSTIVAGKFGAEDYKKALWMATRFYGAQRCGNGPNWLTLDHKVYDGNGGICHINDGDGNYDLEGGWHDCGDHVKFGMTEYYSGYGLLKAYDAFPKGFADNYSWDYEGYRAKDSWGYGDGQPNGIPDVLEEVRYAMDFFMKCVKNENTFYFQISDKPSDHGKWITSTFQSTLPAAQGGEGRVVYKESKGAKAQAAQASSALALFSVLYKKYDADFAKEALEKAKIAYKYAKQATSATASQGGNQYPVKKDPAIIACMISAAVELYRATGEDEYKEDAKYDPVEPNYHALCYNNPNELALHSLNKANINFVLNESSLEKTLEQVYIKQMKNGIFHSGDRTWGPMRYNASCAFAAALVDDALETADHLDLVRDQIDYVLGDNSANLSFLIGFDEQGVKYPKHPHHRNYYLNDDNVADKDNLSVPARNKYLGMLIGGNDNDPNNYTDEVNNYEGSEGGIDYNVGLVGALAYIIQNIAPIEQPDAISEKVVATTSLDITARPNPFNPAVSLDINVVNDRVSSVNVYNIKGELVESFDASQFKNGLNSFTWNASKFSSGVYFLRVTTATTATSKKLILLK